jgi:hypothetical protein
MRGTTKWFKIMTLIAGGTLCGHFGCTLPEVGGLSLAGLIAILGIGAAYLLRPVG